MTSNYPKRITLFDLTYTMSITDLVAIYVKMLRKYSGCFMKKEFNDMIRINSNNMQFIHIIM